MDVGVGLSDEETAICLLWMSRTVVGMETVATSRKGSDWSETIESKRKEDRVCPAPAVATTEKKITNGGPSGNPIQSLQSIYFLQFKRDNGSDVEHDARKLKFIKRASTRWRYITKHPLLPPSDPQQQPSPQPAPTAAHRPSTETREGYQPTKKSVS